MGRLGRKKFSIVRSFHSKYSQKHEGNEGSILKANLGLDAAIMAFRILQFKSRKLTAFLYGLRAILITKKLHLQG